MLKLIKLTCKTYLAFIIVFLSLLFLFGCATMSEKTGSPAAFSIADISDGLPRDGLWRQNLALADMDGDGFLDIIASPTRKAEKEENRPHIFLWDQGTGIWKESASAYPPPGEYGYGYGGVAAGDLNRDGFPDLVLAVHSARTIILQNDKGKAFSHASFPAPKDFHSRAVEVSDLNGDGWPDIVAISEAFDLGTNKINGILLGINKEGKEWDVKIVEGSSELFGDSIAVGDLKGNGTKDIIVAPATSYKEKQKTVWFGDGKGNFRAYDGDFISDTIPFIVRAGDVDGDGKDEIAFFLSGIGLKSKSRLAVYKWTGETFEDISGGLETGEKPVVFDLADVDRDGQKEIIVLSEKGIEIYHYENVDKKWVEKARYPLPPADTSGFFDLRAGRNADGSVFVVYNLGGESPSNNHGIKAFLVK